MSMEYLRPASLDEAVTALAQARGQARVLAGGSDLMIELRKERLSGAEMAGQLVDVADLPELAGARLQGDRIILGAGLTFAQCQEHPLLLERLPLLTQAARSVGSLQIRQVATLGGNVGNMSPAGDGVTALVGLGACARLASAQGLREVLVEDLVAAKGLGPGEIIVNFSLASPAQPLAASFRKVIRRAAVGIARFNLAVQLGLDDAGLISEARLGAGAVFASPRRLTALEGMLLGQPPSPALWRRAAQALVAQMIEAAGKRPSMVYKAPALERVAARTLAQAWSNGRAGKGGQA